MSAVDDLPPLREVIARHGLAAKKSLGQNFLLDLNITAKIARAAGDLAGRDVLEIGPGPGGLTRALLAAGARVTAIERDARCLGALQDISAHYPGALRVIEGDALAVDHASLVPSGAAVVANLPYNIGTELLIGWLRAEPVWWSHLVLMFQKEVALRICAGPGDPHYGRLGVLAGWRAQARRMFDLPPGAFSPPPKVASSVLRLDPRPEPLFPAPLARLERTTAAAFGQRRKMLRQSLKALGGDPAPLIEAAGLDPTARAETVPIKGFCALARALDRRG